MARIFAIVLIAFHLSSSAIANKRCSDLLINHEQPNILVKFQDSKVTPKMVRYVEETIRQGVGMFENQLPIPKEIVLNLSASGTSAGYEAEGNILSTTYRRMILKDGKWILGRPERAKAITIHELTHGVFNLLLKKLIPNYDLRESALKTTGLQKIEPLVLPLFKKVRDLESKIGQVGSYNNKSGELTAALEDVNAKLQQLMPLYNFYAPKVFMSGSADHLGRIESAYSELMSDVAAVAFDGNPRAMSSALVHCKHASEDPLASRDFTIFFDPTTWKEHGDHGLFNPTRHFLWNKYMKNSYGQMTREVFLSKVAHSLVNEIESRLTDQNYWLTPSEANIRLIKRLEQDLADQIQGSQSSILLPSNDK